MNNKQLSHAEREYLKEQEYLKNNQEEVVVKVNKAEKFRKENGYSLTMSKLMVKWNCKTVEEYRVVRKAHKKEGYIGPRKEKKVVASETPTYQKKNNYGGNYNNNNRNNVNRNAGKR